MKTETMNTIAFHAFWIGYSLAVTALMAYAVIPLFIPAS